MFPGTIPRLQEKNIWFLLAICLGQLCVIVVPFFLGAWIPVVVVIALIGWRLLGAASHSWSDVA